ncbi:MAG: hypothetical protein ABI488_12990, partial [Polyangiaceae bacterium]
IARARILGYLQRRGVVQVDADLLVVDDELAERDPVLAQLARAAVSGLAPAGPEFRRGRDAVAFGGRPGVLIAAPLCVREYDFSLHAATHAGAQDLKGARSIAQVHPAAAAGD